MKKNRFSLILSLLFITLLAGSSVFAAANEGNETGPTVAELVRYIIAGVDANDSGRRISVYRVLLPDRSIEVRGRFRVDKIKVKSVEISTDGQVSWQTTILDDAGNFNYTFVPEDGGIYLVYVRASADGKTINDVKSTRRQITVSGRSVRDEVQDTLNGMAEAYRNKNLNQFMKYVDPGFRGDDYQLAWALRRDFAYLSNLELRLLITNFAVGSRGQVSAEMNYNRSVIATRDGGSYTDRGLTQMTFKPSPEGMRLYSMQQPILFGLTYAGAIASGALIAGQNQRILVLNKQGQASLMTINDAIKANDSGGTVTGTTTLGGVPTNYSAFRFSTQSKTTGNSNASIDGDFGMERDCITVDYNLRMAAGTRWAVVAQDIDQVTSISEPTQTVIPAIIDVGTTYSLKLPNGKYALIKMTTASCVLAGGSATFKYRYQPSGSRNF